MKGFRYLLILLFQLQVCYGLCQDTIPRKPSKSILRDTLDGKMDFSRFLVEPKGFLPGVFIITEPALGSFGVGIAPLFFKPHKDLPPDAGYVPPDITAGFAMYTLNGSWFIGGSKYGSIPKMGLKYRFGGGYADVNLNYYRTPEGGAEREYEFNSRAIPISGSISKKITKKGAYAGIRYSYSRRKMSLVSGGSLPDFVKPENLDNSTGALGVFLDFDSRNTVFTPDKGLRSNVSFDVNDSWTLSDFEFQELGIIVNWFHPIARNWITGFRFEGQHVFNDAPFFLFPSINLRGVPFARYQGRSVMAVETEQRVDLTLRWSIVGFAGYGKSMYDKDSKIEGSNVYGVGTGFRYLIARQFGLRTGIDVAKSSDSWGWYIVLGHNWNR